MDEGTMKWQGGEYYSGIYLSGIVLAENPCLYTKSMGATRCLPSGSWIRGTRADD